MATIREDFNFTLSQSGNYNYMIPHYTFSNPEQYGYMVFIQPYDGSALIDTGQIITGEHEDELRYNTTDDTIYFMYATAIIKYDVSPAPNIGEVRYYDGNVYKALDAGATTEPPSDCSASWLLITSDNIDEIYGAGGIFREREMFMMHVPSLIVRTFNLTQTGDHTFSVSVNEVYTVDHAELLKYTGELVETYDNIENTFEFTTPNDGVYYLKIYMTEASVQYVNVYDFTDINKCYYKLITDVLCECGDCGECPGKNYQRALDFSNAYLLLRDIIYTESSVNFGLTDSSVLDTQWLNMVGLLMAKLNIMTENCICND